MEKKKKAYQKAKFYEDETRHTNNFVCTHTSRKRRKRRRQNEEEK